MELTVEQRGDLACDTHHGEQVDAVHGRRRVEDAVANGEHVDERSARLEAVGQQHDPGVVVAEAHLVLGEDHPSRSLAPELALVERHVEDREVRAGERDRDRRPCLEVPGAADDLARVALPHVDLTYAQPVGVRVRLDLEHATDEEAADVAVLVGDADVEDPLDIERRDREPARDLLRRRVDA